MKTKFFRIMVAAIAGAACLMGTVSAHACMPFFFHQPKAPQSLIQRD